MQLYTGELLAKNAWEMLKNDPNAYLIDVRTNSEWDYVGLPDLSSISKKPILIEWLSFPEMQINRDFIFELENQLSNKDVNLIFICRSGGRSAQAAIEMTNNGYNNCYNLTHGFEGDLDTNGHRGKVNGWKADNLPWRQK